MKYRVAFTTNKGDGMTVIVPDCDDALEAIRLALRRYQVDERDIERIDAAPKHTVE